MLVFVTLMAVSLGLVGVFREKTDSETGVFSEGAHQSVTCRYLMPVKGQFKEMLRNTGPFPIASLKHQGPKAH